MKTVEKPWGKEIWVAHTDKYVGKVIWINKGQRLSKQYHNIKHETLYVDSGVLYIEINGEDRVMHEGDAIVITPKTVHRMGAKGSDVKIFEVSTSEVEDVVRLEDDYGRKGK
ncbi:MAG: cupin domain-containing protein [Elusimicrobiota bacterium]